MLLHYCQMLKLSFCYVFNDKHVVSVVCYKFSNKNCDNLTVFFVSGLSVQCHVLHQ